MARLLLLLCLWLLAPAAADARRIASRTPQLHFVYAWPAFPSALPRLEARLTREAGEEQRRARRLAADTWTRDRNDSGEDPPGHSYEKSWTIRAATSRLLALEAANQVYTGGAHEGIAYDALLWDRKGDRVLQLRDLFSAPNRAIAMMERAYCARLRTDQKERRGQGFAESDFRCPGIATVPVVLTGKSRITGFEVLLQPYAVGSWSEGPYEVDLRFSAALIRLVKPEFRSSF
jgi:hypothetical protein